MQDIHGIHKFVCHVLDEQYFDKLVFVNNDLTFSCTVDQSRECKHRTSHHYFVILQGCQRCQKSLATSHNAKLGEITGKTRVLYSEWGNITGKTRVLPCGLVFRTLIYSPCVFRPLLLNHTALAGVNFYKNLLTEKVEPGPISILGQVITNKKLVCVFVICWLGRLLCRWGQSAFNFLMYLDLSF